MSETISQVELESYLWGAATILRGLVDAGDYKQFVFPLLFFKRLSDVWDGDFNQALADSEDADYARDMANERFVIPDGAHWKDVRLTVKHVGQAIQKAMQAIEGANPGRLQGIFGDAPWPNQDRLPDPTLKDLLEHFSTVTLTLENVPEDELGNAYEFLIKKFADDSGHTAQEFYTNRTLVHLMAQMLDPKAEESIYDPTCGTGGMLISALAEVKRNGGEYRTLKLYGQERNHMTAAIARMNLVQADLVDCVLGLGPNLFYNSPMEACVVICRTAKPPERRGKVLFIDGVKQVARVQAQSFLKPEHQTRVLKAYQDFVDAPGFARVATLEEIAEQEYSLSIPLYVRRTLTTDKPGEAKSLKEIWEDWEESGWEFWREMDAVVDMLDGLVTEEVSDN